MIVRVTMVMPMLVLMVVVPMTMVVVRMVMSVFVSVVPLSLLRVGPLHRTAVHEHPEADARKAAAARPAAFDRHSRKTEPCDRLRDHVERHSQVQAGAEEHVSREPARAVEVVV